MDGLSFVEHASKIQKLLYHNDFARYLDSSFLLAKSNICKSSFPKLCVEV